MQPTEPIREENLFVSQKGRKNELSCKEWGEKTFDRSKQLENGNIWPDYNRMAQITRINQQNMKKKME